MDLDCHRVNHKSQQLIHQIQVLIQTTEVQRLPFSKDTQQVKIAMIIIKDAYLTRDATEYIHQRH